MEDNLRESACLISFLVPGGLPNRSLVNNIHSGPCTACTRGKYDNHRLQPKTQSAAHGPNGNKRAVVT